MSDKKSKPALTKAPTSKVVDAPKVASEPNTAATLKVATALKKANLKDKKKRLNRPRNYDLGNGVYRFSRSRMYHKKAIYKFIDKKTQKKVNYNYM
jgi:hypothetical protein